MLMSDNIYVNPRHARTYIALTACCFSLASCASTVDHYPRRSEDLAPAGIVTPTSVSSRSKVRSIDRPQEKTAILSHSKTPTEKEKRWGSLASIPTSLGW